MILPAKVFDQHTVLLGKTRSGKSSTMRYMVEGRLDKKKRVCIIDPKGDWWGIKSSANGKKAGYDVVIFGGAHADVPINAHSGAIVAELVATGNRPCLIDMKGWMPADRTKFFIEFASTLFAKNRGHLLLAIDECHNFAPQGKVLDPMAAKSLHWANRLASEGQGLGIVLISASQRPQKVHKDYLTSHETLIAKRVIHKLDRDAVKDWIDGCADPETGKEVIRTLAGMTRAEGWVWSPEINFGPKLVTFPFFSTYDSFKPQTGKVRKLKGWASVNLDAVKSKLESVVKEAEANDPAKLKARIAELERGARASVAQPVAETPNKKSIEAAEKRGHERGLAEGFNQAQSEMKVLLKGADEAFKKAADGFGKVKLWTNAEVKKWAHKNSVAIPSQPVKPTGVAALKPIAQAKVKAAPPSRAPAKVTEGIDKPLQKIIDAIRWWGAMGNSAPSQAQVAFIAGYIHTSGTWSSYLSRLRSAGMIDGRGEVSLTAAGVAATDGMSFSAGMSGGDALRRAVTDKIDGPLKKILVPLIEVYPKKMTQEELAAAAGYAHTSGTWSSYLSRLRSLSLIDGRGEVVAQAWLFPD